MRQFLTTRLTKNVIFTAAIVTFCGISLSLHAQDDDAELPVINEEATEVEATETEAAEPEVNEEASEAEIPAAEGASKAQAKLEKIDEADVSLDEEDDIDLQNSATPLSDEVEDLKKAALELNRDLLILEEELLFPANSQIVVFLSLDVGHYFALDSVKVLIDDNLVASHLYTKRQNSALSLGGIQRLYLGNLKTGEHEVTAFFVGMGPDNREYKRGATINIEKTDDPLLLELKVRDSEANMQPEFEFEEWEL